jgi:hypothetical protein
LDVLPLGVLFVLRHIIKAGECHRGEGSAGHRRWDVDGQVVGRRAQAAVATIAGRNGIAYQDGNAVTALILQLLAPDATERVGIRRDYVNNIFEHDFFADYDWQQLTDKHVPPPFTPKPHMDISVGKTRAEEIPFPKSEPFTGSQAIFENF